MLKKGVLTAILYEMNMEWDDTYNVSSAPHVQVILTFHFNVYVKSNIIFLFTCYNTFIVDNFSLHIITRILCAPKFLNVSK